MNKLPILQWVTEKSKQTHAGLENQTSTPNSNCRAFNLYLSGNLNLLLQPAGRLIINATK
jgi:hypothetical protein